MLKRIGPDVLRSVQANPFERVPLETTAVRPDRLNLAGRQRTNPFPWRGQFSPELAELLITTFGPRSGTVLDPFAGVGTTLWEAARLGLNALGTEINPAAVTMAESIRFVPLTAADRKRAIRDAKARLAEALGESGCGPLFDKNESSALSKALCTEKSIADAIISATDDLERIILSNVLLRVMNTEPSPSVDAAFRELAAYSDSILGLPHSNHEPKIVHADARCVPSADDSIDLVLTSPPYINVFNYHQNGRQAMEVLGWDLLRVARSEFGANRKHRGNRFLTVIQYALDMTEWLSEMCRVLAPEGRIIVVIGRESMVRGVAFRNGELLASLAEASGFRLTLRQEREFVTRFGELIVEDILHFQLCDAESSSELASALQIAMAALYSASTPCLAQDVASDLQAAIADATTVRPSPLLRSGRPTCPQL